MILGSKKQTCMVEHGGSESKALLLGIFVRMWTHGASIGIGGFPAGQESAPYALVQFESGRIAYVPTERVRLLGSKREFESYCWEDGAEK